MIYKRTDTGATFYYCIPHEKSDEAIWDKWLGEINKIDPTKSGEMLKCMVWGLTQFNAQLLSK